MERNFYKEVTYKNNQIVADSNDCLPSQIRSSSGIDCDKIEYSFCTKEGKGYKLILDVDTDEISLEELTKLE